MEFFTVTVEFNFSSFGDRSVESFLDMDNAIRFMETMEREFKNRVCGDLELEVDEHIFNSNDIHGRVKHVHIESNTGEDTAYINVDRKTFKDGGQ
jgi:hypothetical protein